MKLLLFITIFLTGCYTYHPAPTKPPPTIEQMEAQIVAYRAAADKYSVLGDQYFALYKKAKAANLTDSVEYYETAFRLFESKENHYLNPIDDLRREITKQKLAAYIKTIDQ